MRPSRRSAAFASAGLVAAALLCWFRGRYLVTEVEGQSMEPTLRAGDLLLVRRTKQLRRGKIAVIALPGQATATRLLIKRVVAIPGDAISGAWRGPGLRDLSGTTVPPDSVVVLGDNRPVSWDSRHYGFVRGEWLVGEVLRPLQLPRPRVRASGVKALC